MTKNACISIPDSLNMTLTSLEVYLYQDLWDWTKLLSSVSHHDGKLIFAIWALKCEIEKKELKGDSRDTLDLENRLA